MNIVIATHTSLGTDARRYQLSYHCTEGRFRLKGACSVALLVHPKGHKRIDSSGQAFCSTVIFHLSKLWFFSRSFVSQKCRKTITHFATIAQPAFIFSHKTGEKCGVGELCNARDVVIFSSAFWDSLFLFFKTSGLSSHFVFV